MAGKSIAFGAFRSPNHHLLSKLSDLILMELYPFSPYLLAASNRTDASMTSLPKASSFDAALVRFKLMGPNPLKLCEELLRDVPVACGVRVYDLGSGTGITSVLLAHEYGLDSCAVNL